MGCRQGVQALSIHKSVGLQDETKQIFIHQWPESLNIKMSDSGRWPEKPGCRL